MPRPQLHNTDTILDAARDLVLSDGLRGATIEAIAAASGAPTGSIYHRFGSRDEMIGRAWVRAVKRSQAGFLEALEAADPRDAAVGAARALVEFCREHPGDGQLLLSHSRAELIGARMSADLVGSGSSSELLDDLRDLNKPVERAVVELSRRLYGSASRRNVERVMLVVFDLPYGAVKRHLDTGRPPPADLGDNLERAIRAVI
jgi:AcrR family transcriptional regulator